MSRTRALGFIAILSIGINAIVGSGVFSMPDDMARAMGRASPLAFVLCALVLIPVALSFAELASNESRTGGPYRYVREALGPTVGFITGWACYLNAFLSFAANVTLLIALLGVPSATLAFRALAVVVVLGLGLINYRGVRPGAALIVAMTVGKLAAIGVFLAVAAKHFSWSALSGTPWPAGPPSAEPSLTAAGILSGVHLALFPLQGFETVPVPAGEAKNPKRDVPWATVLSLVLSALLFTLVQLALVGSYADLSKPSDTPLVDAAKSFAPWVFSVVAAGSLISVGGFSAGSALGAPRYAEALGAEGDLSPRLAERHARFGTPHIAILVTTLVTAVLAAFFTYRELVGFSNVTVVLQYALTCVCVPILRKRRPNESGGFRVPGGALIPILGVIGSSSLLLGSSTTELVWCAGGLALGGLVYVLSRGRSPSSAA